MRAVEVLGTGAVTLFAHVAEMTPKDFLDLSTRLCKDLKYWTGEMSRRDKLSPNDLERLKETYRVIERVTLEAAAPAAAAAHVPPE